MIPRLQLISRDANLTQMKSLLKNTDYRIQEHSPESLLLIFPDGVSERDSTLITIWLESNRPDLD
jgi:hypothetical protein